MTTGTAPDLAALAALRDRLTGALALPDESGYALAIPWNVAIPVRPAAVVAAATAQDIAETLGAAQALGLRVAVQCTGHGAGELGHDTVLVHTAGLDTCEIDPDNRTARIDAGVRWQQVLNAATPHGLTPLVGSSPGVGAIGFLTGGGVGPMVRTYGLSADHVRSFEVVTGDGEVRRASDQENPELFWALRGGKSAVGIVTEMETELPEFYGGSLWFDGTDAAVVLPAWLAWCAALPTQGTTSIALVQAPAMPGIPPVLVGKLTVSVRFVWTGDPAEGARQLAALRAVATPLLDGIGLLPYDQIAAVHQDPTDPLPLHEGTLLLIDLPARAVDALLVVAGIGSGSPQIIVEVRQLGGALNRPDAPDCAFSHRQAAFSLLVIGIEAPPIAEAVAEHCARVVAALQPWSTGGVFPNFGSRAPAEQRYVGPTLERLREVAKKYDPAGVLDGGQRLREPSVDLRDLARKLPLTNPAGRLARST